MRSPLLALFFSLVLIGSLYAQNTFLAIGSGNWSNPAIWDCGGCGETFPQGGDDDVFTEGFLITLNSVSQSVGNIYVAYNVAGGLRRTIGSTTLNVNGQLASYDPALFDYAAPTTTIVTGGISFVFTGSSLAIPTDPVITSWSSSAPLRSLTFNPPLGSTTLYLGGVSLSNGGVINVATGIAELLSGETVSAPGATIGSITVASGATLVVQGAINGDGTTSSRFPTCRINGTLTAGSAGYLNASNFSLASTGVINVGFQGSNQTEGWWYQSASPDVTLSIDNASTINYSANANQAIYAMGYGNLNVSSTGSTTKTIAGSGDFSVAGNFVNSTSGTSITSTNTNPKTFSGNAQVNGTLTFGQLALFNGSADQTLSGTGSSTFGGLQVSKSNSLILSQNVTSTNGLTISSGTLNPQSQTITLGTGNIDNNGTFSQGTSTVIINGTTSITGSNTVNFNNLTVGGTGNFTAPGGTLNIYGNFSCSGTFNRNGGTVALVGGSPQSLTGSAGFQNLSVSASSDVSVDGNMDLFGTFTLSNGGLFDADGSGSGVFRIRSTSVSSTGRIASLTTPADFTGAVTVQRYVDAPADWRYFSVPVIGANLSMWRDNFAVTGSFSDASSGGLVTNSSAPSVFRYDAATQAWIAASAASTSAYALSNTTGYSAYTYLSGDVAVDVTGTIGKGNTNISLSTGWNLIPNPYPSAIDWDGVALGGVPLTSSTMYVRLSNGVFATYLQGGPAAGAAHPVGGWNGEVALGQSFWVEASGAGSLQFTETAKTGSFTFVREGQTTDMIRIILAKDDVRDEAVVYFSDDATLALDKQYDSPKRTNEINFGIATRNHEQGSDLAINGVPYLNCEFSTSIDLSNSGKGLYALTFADLETMTTGYVIELIDTYLGERVSVSADLEYAFEITTDPLSKQDGRFVLSFVSPEINPVQELVIVDQAECTSSFAKVTIDNSQKGIQYQFVKDGNAISDPVLGNGQQIVSFVDRTQLEYGTNVLSLLAATQDGCHALQYPNIFSLTHEPIAEITKSDEVFGCVGEQLTLQAEGAPVNGSYNWYESEDAITPIEGQHEATFLTSAIDESKLYYVTAVNSSGCESQVRAEVKATVTHVDKPVIATLGTTMMVNAKNGIQWFKDGEPLVGETGIELDIVESGLYAVSVTENGCTAMSDVVEFLVSGVEDHRYSMISVSPNPTDGLVTIVLPDGIRQDVNAISVYSSKGSEIAVISDKRVLSQDDVKLDLQEKRKGLYIVNIVIGRKVVSLKVAKK